MSEDETVRAPTKTKVILPPGSDPSRGPGWTDLWIREDTSDEAVLHEVWIDDAYHLRGLDLSPTYDPGTRDATTAIVDVGACTGIFTALALQMFPTAHVVAVEPDPDNYDLLFLNTSPWVAQNRIHLHRCAVGPDVGTTMLLGGQGTGHTDRDAPDGGRPVEQITLGELLTGWVALLKIDIEGGEYDAIAACPSPLLNHAERIVMEWHGTAEAPWVFDAPARYGALLTKLAYTHSVQTFGSPDRGGYLFATRY